MMPVSADASRAQAPVTRRCTLWVHDEYSSKEDVILNRDAFPAGELKCGALAQIVAVDPLPCTNSSVEEGQRFKPGEKHASERKNVFPLPAAAAAAGGQSFRRSQGARARNMPLSATPCRGYLFLVNESTFEHKKQPNLQVSVAANIANAFGFRNRMQVEVTVVDKAQCSASHVEIAFKDEYLARADMWRLAISELNQKTIYKSQKLLFIGSIKARIKHVYLRGKRVSSAFFSADTKPIFRSESARQVLFLQMSREMWEFDSDASGEIMFNRVINGFLPDLFQRWADMGARHLVSIVLFTRAEYDYGTASAASFGGHGVSRLESKHHEDYYRVVVSETANVQWPTILDELKKEFRVFWRDIAIRPLGDVRRSSDAERSNIGTSDEQLRPEALVLGKPSAASRGNILEAINVACSQASMDYVDRDLVRTGLSVVIVTPGSGLFEVDHDLLRSTTEYLTNIGTAIDVVCLSRMPLHSVPLFKYRNPMLSQLSKQVAQWKNKQQGVVSDAAKFHDKTSSSPHSYASVTKRLGIDSEGRQASQSFSYAEPWIYAVPTWIDVSYWNGQTLTTIEQSPSYSLRKRAALSDPRTVVGFVPRAKMYELQMMGIMENEMSNISLPYIQQSMQQSKIQRLRLPRSGSLAFEERAMTDDNQLQTNLQTRSADVPSAFAKVGSERVLSKAEKDKHQWMDAYDDQVFRPWQPLTQATQPARSLQTDAYANHGVEGYRSPSIDSFDDHRVSETPTVNPRASYLDHKVTAGPKNFSRIETPKKDLTVQAARTARLPIGLGNRSYGYTSLRLKALASTEVKTEHASTAVLTHRSFSERSPASRHRKNSMMSEGPAIPETPKHDQPSRPIPIQRLASTPDRHDDMKPDIDTDGDGSPRRADKLDVLQAASIVKQAGPKLDLASQAPKLAPTLSLTAALAPWLNSINPSHPKKNGLDSTAQFGRWQHAFPRPLRASMIKWKSLCSPAEMPLTTDCFPTAAELASDFLENPYHVSTNEEEDLNEVPKYRDDLLKELIGLRLTQGFQFVVGEAVAEAFRHPPLKDFNVFDENYLTDGAAMIVMSLGNSIHQIQRVGAGELEVKRFVRKPVAQNMQPSASNEGRPQYRMHIKTTLAEGYEPRQVTLPAPRDEYNWNYVDSFLAGYTDSFTEQLRFWRARFVLIPVEQPAAVKSAAYLPAEDNEEEIRIEGIRKFTQMLQRHRFQSQDDRRSHGKSWQKQDANPLDIVYHTRDPSAVVAAELDALPLIESDSGQKRGRLFTEDELFQRSNVNLASLAQVIQGEKGVQMQDRRWHWRLHYNCFIGSEMTTWLLENFEDVDSREEAVELGNELMNAGLFQHVEKRHQFRDGNFFYQLGPEYRNPRADSRRGWFGTRKSERSVPSTPVSEASRDSPQVDRSRGGPRPDSIAADSEAPTPTATNAGGSGKRLRVALSKVMFYDVDHRKRSYRREIINLHYDRIHNPDNCYHIRIDWMKVTAKLIEDAIVTWATTVEKYGLRLVEVPIREASSIVETHPLRSPYLVRLARPPPPGQPHWFYDAESLAPRTRFDPHFYHKAIMKRFGFVLDIEAATNFPPDVEITYSWGKPDYRYTQYIHRSGLLLAQITDGGEFLLLANRLYNNRSASSGDKFDRSDARDRRSGSYLSPFASPLVRAAHEPAANSGGGPAETDSAQSRLTAEDLKDKIQAFCADADALQQFYDELLTKAGSLVPATPVLEASIPVLGLPPSAFARESSASLSHLSSSHAVFPSELRLSNEGEAAALPAAEEGL